MRSLSQLDCALLNSVQRDFPLDSSPFATIGAELGLSEQSVIDRLRELQSEHAISRFGAVFTPNVAGVSTLAALAVPEDRIEEVASLVSATAGVNHNYLREHDYNLWFVIAAKDREQLDQRLQQLQTLTGLPLLDLPMEQAYHIDLGFPL
jgi:DNA-binding Lrp family transcriptional regulator